MTRRLNAPGHPGSYVRERVIPAGMSVTEAARRLGIGRPALSNFLNGRSSLSPEMAVRLEKAFGADRKYLLEVQAAFHGEERRSGDKGLAVRAFVPSFLSIKAWQIDAWAGSQVDARTHLPVLLRRLVHSTGHELRQVDFPGYDNAQRKGSDGFVEAGAATPWVPEGKSYWEFGAAQRPQGKANHDYAARLTSVDRSERARSTFVFVTPRNWPGKTAWAEGKSKSGAWKAVRALDASDLEQWLEQSVPAQIWLAEQLSIPTCGYETLEQAWHRWAEASEPNLRPEIFEPSIAAYRGAVKTWLETSPDRPFIVAADSTDEALAFLACLLDDALFCRFKDLAAIFTNPATLRTLVASSVPFVPIVHSEQAERELADTHKRLHCIIIRPRNTVDTKADIALELLGHTAFEKALTAMGIDEAEVDRYARESGRSPTILRRRLSKTPAIKTPPWASDRETAKSLVPMALIGTWHAESAADREIVSRVADRKYETIEDDVASLLRYEESPVWSVDQHRGVASKIDALFAVAGVVTPVDLKRFFAAAEHVLAEADPALDLPEADRWAAGLYGKKRDHSGALRAGICETLVIFSTHGNNLFHHRLGTDVERQVANLIRNLLTPLNLTKLLSHDHDLPRYAEAAPDEFLKIVEDDLRADEPVVFRLLKSVDVNSPLASPLRTGFLWALECLAWKPQNLPRVSLILAQLSGPSIDDNWANKPAASLHAIFRSWMPQTAASVEQRVKALKMLMRRFPGVAWDVCNEQIKPGPRSGFRSYRPLWRSDASGAGQVATYGEIYDFNRQALELLIGWPAHDERTLGDLVESLQAIPDHDQVRIWDLVDQWSEDADDVAKAALRERIRRFALTRRGRNRKLGEAIRDRAQEAYDRLRPHDPLMRHRWLFATHWVEESAEEIQEDEPDYRKREERIRQLRKGALAELWAERGFEGVLDLLRESGAEAVVGHYAAWCVSAPEQRVDFIRRCLAVEEDLLIKAKLCLQGFLSTIEDDSRSDLLGAAAEEIAPEDRKRLLVCAPFSGPTWRLLDEYGEELRTAYWRDVTPLWAKHTPAETTELVDRLLEARRPRAAFHAVHMHFKDVETSRLKRLLRDIATVNAEPAGDFPLERWAISEAVNSLDGRPGVTPDEMAHLEFLFIEVLEHSKHRIPNLESKIAQSPALFVQAVALAYKRSDAAEDPPELKVEDPERRAAVASAAHRLLDCIKKIPGADESGRIDAQALTGWLNEARRLFRKYARFEIGDEHLGQLLAKAPGGDDGAWPCEAVCEAMEGIASRAVATGFYVGVLNSRGFHWRGEGGEQERELAAKYHTCAERVQFDYPFVGGVLEDIAASYEREARRQDAEAQVERRLRQ